MIEVSEHEVGQLLQSGRLAFLEAPVHDPDGVPVGELAPLRRYRFVAAETAVAVFKTAPAVDYERFRADLEGMARQDATPRG